jgi:hypothetical protein
MKTAWEILSGSAWASVPRPEGFAEAYAKSQVKAAEAFRSGEARYGGKNKNVETKIDDVDADDADES